MYTENIVEGEDYSILPKTICVNILDYNLKEIDNTYYHNIFRLSNVYSNKILIDKIEIHFIELKKFEHCNINNLLDLWIEFIKNPESSIIQTIEENNKEIKKAKTELTVISSNDDERAKYRISEDTIREEVNALNSARLEGKLDGELSKSIEIVINSLSILDNKAISKITGLSLDEIIKLRSDKKNN